MSAGRIVTLALGHPCCTGVLCAHGSRATDVDAALSAGGGQLVLRGAPMSRLRSLVEGARGYGFSEVTLATAGLDRPGAVDAIADAGIDAVRATLFSHAPPVHDRLAGRPEALAGALFALRKLALPITVEAPILPLRLSDPRRLVDLALRAVGPSAVRFYAPRAPVPAAIAPPPWPAIAPALEEAVGAALAAGCDVTFDASQAVPLCAFGGSEAMHPRFRFPRRGRAPAEPPEACAGCAVLAACGGPSPAYLAANGARGLAPFARRPKALTGRRPRPGPRWTPATRRAARDVQFLVFRPTVHCNQDCLFCSANESSANAFSEPKRMLRAIARAAARGVRRVSFSGGEPTLVPSLPDYVAAASRCGIPEVELVTNGVLLDRDGKVERLREAGLTHAFVSLHAHDEALSRAMTQKVGDHARTLGAIDRLLDAGVLVAVNHVITTRNQGYLRAFVETLHRRFGGRVFLSFAFVTPQYKALEHPELVPRFAETTPHLRAAMRRAVELEQPFVVGSRQGVPPCLLGPFAAWSDVFGITAEAGSEDAPQKAQGPPCARCRYRAICPGLWRPYAERHGFEELTPLEGPPWSDDELAEIRGLHRRPPWGVPLRFDEAPPLLRDRAAEAAPDPAPPRVVSLPLAPQRTRPLRVLLLGSGRRARALVERSRDVPELAWVGVASPHAPDAVRWWGGVPTFRGAREAIEELAPEAVVIAAASEAHEELAQVCAAAGLPALLEKPVAPTAERARRLAEVLEDAWVSCAIQEVFLPGIGPVLDAPGDAEIDWQTRPDAPDAPRAWGYAPLFETLQHALAIPAICRGPAVEVLAVEHAGGSRPERLRARWRSARGEHGLSLRFDAREDALTVRLGAARWSRSEGRVEVDGARVEVQRGETARMLAAFARAVLDGGPPPVPLSRGVAVLASTEALLEAFQHAGAPLSRASAPKHVRSKRYRTDRSGR